MDSEKRARLEAAGWAIGTADDFLKPSICVDERLQKDLNFATALLLTNGDLEIAILIFKAILVRCLSRKRA
jgi:hypothetical protein